MQATRRDMLIIAGVLGAGLVMLAGAVFFALDEVTLSTQDSPLGQTIANAAIVIGVVGALAPLLQARRMIVTQSAEDVSLGFLVLYAATYVMGLAVGVIALMPALFIPNTLGSVTVFTSLVCAVMIRWRYRNWNELEALRSDDAAQGALVELDTESDYPATLNEETTSEA